MSDKKLKRKLNINFSEKIKRKMLTEKFSIISANGKQLNQLKYTSMRIYL